MPLKLTERNLVKDFLGVNRADALLNPMIDGMIEQISDEVEGLLPRKFTKVERTEYHPSYDQNIADPMPQFIKLEAYPLDTALPITVHYSSCEDWDSEGFLLVADSDYRVASAEKGVLTVRRASTILSEIAPIGGINLIYRMASRGFRVTYTGGYAITADSSPLVADPLDDFGVVQVPMGLKTLLARKIAFDWMEKKMLQPWRPEELKMLYIYRR